MKALKEFDYDLWITRENMTIHYWVRVKATGEVCEVTHEVMKLLRNEEKRMRREIEKIVRRGGPDLSYDAFLLEDKSTAYLPDPVDMEEEVLNSLHIEEFRKTLTPVQCSVFDACLIEKKSVGEHARCCGRSVKTVYNTIDAIRKKYKKYFSCHGKLCKKVSVVG